MKKYQIIIAFCIIQLFISCEPETLCLPPSSDQLYIAIKDSNGNNIIENQYPNLSLTLADSNNSHVVKSIIVVNNGISERIWQFQLDSMISEFNYLLEYDNQTIDTISVKWFYSATNCDRTTYYSRKITSVKYNDSTFHSGGFHTLIK